MRRLALIAVLASGSAQGQGLPTWTLGAPRVEIGRDGGIDFHSIRGAGFLSNGRIVVGDGGNQRLIVFDSKGRQLAQMGKKGSGPGAFEVLYTVQTFGDTILASAAVPARLIAWKPDGTHLFTTFPTGPKEAMTEVRALVSSTRAIVTYNPRHEGGDAGLFYDTVGVGMFDSPTHRTLELGRREWNHTFVYNQAITEKRDGRTVTLGYGSSAYRTPFLGKTLVAVAAERFVFVPLGSTSVEIASGPDMPGHRIPLPVSRGAFDRATIDLYRDSLVASARRQGDESSMERLGVVFGPTFPVPKNVSAVESMQAVGSRVWMRAFPTRADSLAQWFILDPAAGAFVGQARINKNWQILGGSDTELLMLRRDADGVEYVAVQPIRKP